MAGGENMPAETYNLTSDNNAEIEQGATYTFTLTWKDSTNTPVDLTGYTARMQLRRTVPSTDTLLSLTDSDGIAFAADRTTGVLTVTMTAAQTAALTGTSAVYDLELISASGVVYRLIEGDVEISPEVTR